MLDNKNQIIEAIKKFDKYPPLTSRLICCLYFLKICLKNNDVKTYLDLRNSKYINQFNIIQNNLTNFDIPLNYFNSWLSGFIEAEGCFSIRKNGISSFSIAQEKDSYLLKAIKIYFDASNIIKTPYINKSIYSLEIYNKITLLKIINHCELFPLLGAKYDSLLKFKNFFE